MAYKNKINSARLRQQFSGLRTLISVFRLNKRGNVAIIFAVSALPLIGAVGAAVDYSMAAMVKTKLQAAADQASLAAVSLDSSPVTTATNMTSNGTVSGGSTFAKNFFNANLTTTTGYTSLTPTATVTKTGTTITANVSFTANVPTFFMAVMGVQNVAISGSSTSSYTLPTYINFYLMLDVSGSMGFPSTSSEQTRLESANPDNKDVYPGGCTFACHFSAQGACDAPVTTAPSGAPSNWNQYCQGYIVSRNGGNYHNTPVTSCPTAGTSACIQLQADAVGYAVQQLLSTAAAAEVVSNQYQVGLYPFIQYLYSYFPITSNITGSPTNSSTINYAAANLANLLDTGANSNLGSGGTHFENAFPSMNTIISSVGDGSSWSSPLPYVFLITDGAQDSQVQWGGNWSGSNNATVMDTSYCTTLKNRGITIAVLYVPYQPIQNPTTIYNNEDGAVNAIIPNIPSALQSCASPNFYFTASSPTAITNTMITMFNQVVKTAHISQ